MQSFFLICPPHWRPSILLYRRRPACTGVRCSKRHLPGKEQLSSNSLSFTTVIRVHLCCLPMLHIMVSEQYVLSHSFPDGSEKLIVYASRSLPQHSLGTPKLIRKLLLLFLMSQTLDSTYLDNTSLSSQTIILLFIASITTRLYQLQLHLEFSDSHLSSVHMTIQLLVTQEDLMPMPMRSAAFNY